MRRIISVQECVPTPCVAHVANVDVQEFSLPGFAMSSRPPGVARSSELGLPLVADGGDSETKRVSVVAGDSSESFFAE